MTNPIKLSDALEDKDVSDLTRGVVALTIWCLRQGSAGNGITPKSAFERADNFIEEWKKQIK